MKRRCGPWLSFSGAGVPVTPYWTLGYMDLASRREGVPEIGIGGHPQIFCDQSQGSGESNYRRKSQNKTQVEHTKGSDQRGRENPKACGLWKSEERRVSRRAHQ